MLVLGGGPAAAAAALALSRAGRCVVLLARRPTAPPPIGETVPPTIIRPLARLGLWESFVAAGHRQSPSAVVLWGSDAPFENEFIMNAYGAGWHLDRARFDTMLLDAARAAGADVQVHERMAVPDIPVRWTIDATGRASSFARRQGAKRHSVDRLIALVRFGSLASTDDRTVIEARPEGWWYAAALPDNRVTVAFFTDSDLLAAHRVELWDRLLGETKLVSRVAAATHDLSAVHIVGAASGYLSCVAGRDWLAIGDAAQSHDPCSGQGIAKALESALAAAEAIGSCREGDRRAIERFAERNTQEWRRFLHNRGVHYRREMRWPDSPFWRRRHDDGSKTDVMGDQ